MNETTRISSDVRHAPRGLLIAELEDFATDRTSHGKHARAAGALAAARQLQDGATEVTFEHTVYRVGDPDRNASRQLPRAEILAELEHSGIGWAHFGKEGLAREAARAVEAIESGAERVRVGHVEYVVAPEA